MKISKKTIVISSIIVVSLALLIALAAIIKINVSKPKMLNKLEEGVDLQIKGFVYTEVGDAKTKWEVKAETATYNKNQNIAVFDKVQMKLTTSNGKVFLISADKGQMFTDQKNVEIKEKVVIVSDTGDKFSTDYLKYSDAEKKFYTDAEITMENKRMKITGKGLVVFMNKEELQIPSTVKAIIN